MGPEQFRLHAELEEDHWWFTARRTIAHAVVQRLLPPEHGGTVVDVGCGTGANIGSLAGRYHVVGIDPSPEAVSHARVRYPGARFLCGRAPEDLGNVVDDADLFLLMDVLEHVPDDRRLLASLLAASRPGAHVLITVPADMSLWSEHDVAFGHYRRYDPRTFRDLWEGMPVTVRLLSHFNTRLYAATKAVRTVNRWRGETAGRAGTDLSSPPRVLNRILHSVFAGESKRLLRRLDDGHLRSSPRGVSLLAVLRREPGPVPSAARGRA